MEILAFLFRSSVALALCFAFIVGPAPVLAAPAGGKPASPQTWVPIQSNLDIRSTPIGTLYIPKQDIYFGTPDSEGYCHELFGEMIRVLGFDPGNNLVNPYKQGAALLSYFGSPFTLHKNTRLTVTDRTDYSDVGHSVSGDQVVDNGANYWEGGDGGMSPKTSGAPPEVFGGSSRRYRHATTPSTVIPSNQVKLILTAGNGAQITLVNMYYGPATGGYLDWRTEQINNGQPPPSVRADYLSNYFWIGNYRP